MNVFERIESTEFCVRTCIASSWNLAERLIRETADFEDLKKVPPLEIIQRAIQLIDRPYDTKYSFPWDTALCAYAMAVADYEMDAAKYICLRAANRVSPFWLSVYHDGYLSANPIFRVMTAEERTEMEKLTLVVHEEVETLLKKRSDRWCCDDMKQRTAHTCEDHDKWECPDVLIHRTKHNDFGIIVHDGGSSFIAINFCPWCGDRLTRR